MLEKKQAAHQTNAIYKLFSSTKNFLPTTDSKTHKLFSKTVRIIVLLIDLKKLGIHLCLTGLSFIKRHGLPCCCYQSW